MRAPTFITLLGLWLGLAAHAGHAGELSDFNAAVEAAAVHQRAALGYLRTGSVDLAALELEHMDAAWKALFGRFGSRRPDAFVGNPLYVTTLTDVSVRLVAARI